MKTLILFAISFIIIICLSAIISASLYDKLETLKGKNCNLIEKDYISSTTRTALINKFGLTGGGDCNIIVDSIDSGLDQESANLLWFGPAFDSWCAPPWYAEMDYTFKRSIYVSENNKEYLIILGKDYSALDKIANIAANYETYRYYLTSKSSFYLPEDFFTDYYDPTYTGPSNDHCVQTNGTVYTGNSGSYLGINGNSVTFNSVCNNSRTIFFPFCEGNTFAISAYFCGCVANKCIASFTDVFNWLGLHGLGAGPGNTIVDNNLISSSISSWIRN